MDWQERLAFARQRAKHSSREALNILFSGQPHGHTHDMRSVDPHSEEARRLRRTKRCAAERVINSPIGMMAFAFGERNFLFEPDSLFEGCDAGELKHPQAYGLEGYQQYSLEGPRDARYGAWYVPARDGFPTIAYCHGNAGPLDARASVIKALSDRGFGVMIVAYPGFKGSRRDAQGQAQSPSEVGCKNAAYAMVRTLQADLQVPAERIVLFGESLGSAMAIDTACRMEKGLRRRNSKNPLQAWGEAGQNAPDLLTRVHKTLSESLNPEPRHITLVPPQKPAAVITFAAFASMARRVKEEYPMMPVDTMENRFDSESIIGRLKSDVLLLHGTADEMTGAHHSKILKDRGGPNVTLVLMEGANHRLTPPGSDIPDRAQVEKMIDRMQSWLSERGICPPVGLTEPQSGTGEASWRKRASEAAGAKILCP